MNHKFLLFVAAAFVLPKDDNNVASEPEVAPEDKDLLFLETILHNPDGKSDYQVSRNIQNI